MMEQVYALGITCIQFIQDRFSDCDEYFHFVNDVSNPYHVVQYMFPFLAAIDSVFAAQFLLCIGFGNWLNTVMKWWLLEDRPYWWVRETTFYNGIDRPTVQQFPETCETGPGSPSGHSATAASVLILIVMWMSHVMHDRRCTARWCVWLCMCLVCTSLLSVLTARLYVAAHFPHQTLLGALQGAFVSPFLCIYVADPYIFKYGVSVARPVKVHMWWHAVFSLLAVVVAALTYLALRAQGIDPMYTVQLAFRWCMFPEHIRVTTNPLYALVSATAMLLGWALTVTPHVANHRYYTKRRSLKIAFLSAGVIFYVLKRFSQETCDRYSIHFLISIARPALYLRLVPYLSLKAGSDGGRMWLDEATSSCFDNCG